MNILITGSKGQLGREILEIENKFKNFRFLFTDIDELDISDQQAIENYLSKYKINWVINCAAYTNVDKAEKEKELAKKINVDAIKTLVKATKKHKTILIHFSSDYVFNGLKCFPYNETDLTNPISYYGLTKAESEKTILKHSEKAIIIRTSWLYSTYGENFVKRILKLASENKELRVVNDQIGTPTYAADLASTILHIIENYYPKNVEIFHYSNEGICSWYDFAKAIIKIKKINCEIRPIESKNYPTSAKRPAYSVLDKSKITKTLNIKIPHWKDSLENCLNKL